MAWAVCNKDREKASVKVIEPLCPWPKNSFLYDGLCTHTPLIEGMKHRKKDLGIAPEILDQLHQEAVAHARYMKNIGRPTVWRAQSRAKCNAQSRVAYARDKR